MINLKELTITKVHEAYRSGEFTAVDLVSAYLDEIKKKNSDLNIYLEVFDDVLELAKIADEKIKTGDFGILTGIPFAIKDNILIEGRVATAASKILENYKATYTATATKRLIDAGAIFIGRANMDEFAMGGSTENSAFGPTKNPVDSERVAGGSSGGSVAAVAADMALVALGSDTGGSIRQPASFCGVVGMKPTYGAVSRHGLMAMASSLDVIGPIAKNIEDAEIVFNVIGGKDSFDSTSVDVLENVEEVKKIGVPRKYLEGEVGKGMDKDVLDNFNVSVEKLKQSGYEIVDVELPNLDYSLAVYYVLMPAEVSSNMARYDGVKFGGKIPGNNLVEDYLNTRGELIGAEVKRRIILGTYVLSAGYSDEYYNKAWQVRNLIKKDFTEAFKKVDVIAMPVSPTPAFKIGEKADDPIQMYLADIFTVSANLAGIPAVSIPSGAVERDEKELPVGLQLFAPQFNDKKLFQVGRNFEKMK